MNSQRLILQLLSRLPAPLLRRMGGAPISARGTALDPMLQFLWVAGKKLPDTCQLPVDQARAGLEAGAAMMQAKVPAEISTREITIPGPASSLPARVYTPPATGPRPVLVFFHFGGCVIGSRNICDGFCGLLASRAKVVVLNVDYRLAPEHKYPAALEDAIAAYRWTLDNAAALGGDPKRVAVGGDSAGGLLSAATTQEAKRRGWPMPACQLLIYPWLAPRSDLKSYTDFADAYPLTANTMKWFADHFFASDMDRRHPWADPLNTPDLAGLSPALIFTAGFDPLRDEGEAYAQRLKAAGVAVHFHCHAHLVHAYTMMGGTVPAAQRAMIEIADALARQLN